MLTQTCRNRGTAGGDCSPTHQNFVKADLLPIDNNSEKKKLAKKNKTSLNYSKIAGNITLFHFI